MSKQKPTSDEHFIPQFYLKQFSPDGEHVYQFDVLSGIQTPVPVPTKSICYQKNLYEFQNENGDFLHQNLLERLLSKYEGQFAEVFGSIQKKASSKGGFLTPEFLSDKEIAMLSFFLSTMIARKPEILQAGREVAKEIFGDTISDYIAKNISLLMLLPLFKEINPNDKNVLIKIMGFFEDMSFQIGVSKQLVFWTSDNPITLYGKIPPVKPDEVILPLSPCLVLYMKPYKITKPECDNRLVELRERDVEFVNHSTATHCQRWIYSHSPLSEKQKKWIAEQRKR